MVKDPNTPLLGWVDFLPTNKTKEQQLEKLLAINKLKKSQELKCSYCTTKFNYVTATKYCKSCKEYYCDECGNQHWLLRTTKDHRVFLIDDLFELKTDSLLRSSFSMLFNAVWRGRGVTRKYQVEPQRISEQEKDEVDANITGATFLPNRLIILADNDNSRIKLFDHHLVLRTCVKTNCFDLLCIDNSSVVVTCPKDKCVKFYEIDGEILTENESHTTDGECYGICRMGQRSFAILVVSSTLSIVIYTRYKFARKFDLQSGSVTMKHPKYIEYCKAKHMFYLSDSSSGCLKCFSSTGVVIWERIVNGCFGLAVFGDKLLVSRNDRCTVDLVNDKGQFLKSVITVEDGLTNVQAIRTNYRKLKTRTISLIVTEKSNLVRVFQIEDPLQDDDIRAYVLPSAVSPSAASGRSNKDKKSKACNIL